MKLRMVIPIEIAVIGLLGAIYYGYHAVKGPDPEPKADQSSRTATAKPSPTPTVTTTRLVSKKGRFSIDVPEDVKAKKVGFTVQMMTADKALSVLVGPVERGTLAKSSKSFMRGMKQVYKDVRVTTSESKTINGHKAKATYGRAVNAKKVQITFVNVVIKTKLRNYAINAFTAIDSDPLFVIPRVNAIVNNFDIIK